MKVEHDDLTDHELLVELLGKLIELEMRLNPLLVMFENPPPMLAPLIAMANENGE